ncbi:NACHT domain-containing protein [Leptospira sp. 96542]|nr:NACHT domain-containing protein [Leptospira sp. 96542]
MDFSSKKSLVEAINDEVGVLHPLLEHLLRQIADVTHVEYTHGPNEKGADFIVARRDAALGLTSHIGVVAKIGKILQNFDDVSRQVEECLLPRSILGGKEQVRLTEVWVVNTSSISRNAQDKIQDKYKTQKINFIPGEKLTELIDKYADYFWYDVPSAVGSYLRDLSNRLTKLDSELSVLKGLECDNFYVPPDIQEFSKPLYSRHARPPKPHLVNLQEIVLKEKISFLEGDMGFGKSKTARAITLHYTAPEIFKRLSVIPVFLSFKAYCDSQKTLLDLLQEETKPYFDVSTYPKSDVLFILDGVDEATGKNGDWKERLREAIQEANSSQRLHLLLTTRPLRQLDESVNLYAGASRYLLRPLSLNKLVSFVEKACASLSLPKRLFEDLQKSDLFKQLPQSPIAAALLSRLIAQNTNDLPSNLTELYSKSIENLLGRWDIEKGSCTEKEYKDAERVSFMLADYMVGNQLPYMNLQEAKEKVSEWHRLRNTNVSLEVLNQRVFEKSGIFVTDEENGLLAFRHRSFGEFLTAKAWQISGKKLSSRDSFTPYWAFVQFFYTGLLGDCEEHLHQLLSYAPQTEAESWLKIILMPDYFLAGYQTPYVLAEENLYKLFIEAAELYSEIRKGNTKTKLGELPEMHLLWFFQRVIRSCFEFEFFRKSITTTLLKIDQEIIDTKVKEIALFFASCYAAQLEDPSGFEFLIDRYPTERLQLPIALAIRMEQETNKDFSKLPILKEHERKLKSLLSLGGGQKKLSGLNTAKVMDDLFERPVKARKIE